MKVRLKQPAVEARLWDGDLPGMEAWLRVNATLHVHCERSRLDHSRLRVTAPRFTYSLAVGDWLVASNDKASLWRVMKDEFEAQYERLS